MSINKNEPKFSNIVWIGRVLNKAYKTVGNPIMLFDTSYNLLCHTENTVKDDYLWNEIIESGTFSHETVNFFNKENFIDNVAVSDVISILNSDNLKYNRLNAKIFDKDDIHIANITIIACYRAFKKSDFANIKIICENLSVELQKSDYYKKIDRVFEETFITNLIDGKVKEKSNVQKLEELYTDLKGQLYVGVIDITKYEYTLTHLAYFRDLFKKIQGEFKYFIYLNNVVALISTDNPILNINRDLNKLNKFCINNTLYMGISESFHNLLELQKYYKQALNALNYGLNVNADNERNIFEYANFKPDFFLSDINSRADIKELCHPIIFLIQKHDQKNKTLYYNILFTYLLVGKNAHLASQILNIDYKKFNNKLKKITELFGIDWNNGDMLLSIFLSMKINKHFL